MMPPILTVITPADSYDLTVLATVKAELGITDSNSDAQLETWIDQASSIFASECDRVFAKETVSEQFRPNFYRDPAPLPLSRCPVSSITSVTEAGTVLDPVDYEVDPAIGLLYRLSGGARTCWGFGKITVLYIGGYEPLPDLPHDIERAVISLVKQYHFGSTRDPALKSEEVIGVQRFDYRVSNGADDGAFPPEFERTVLKYRQPPIG
jgi:hypothetical protein